MGTQTHDLSAVNPVIIDLSKVVQSARVAGEIEIDNVGVVANVVKFTHGLSFSDDLKTFSDDLKTITESEEESPLQTLPKTVTEALQPKSISEMFYDNKVVEASEYGGKAASLYKLLKMNYHVPWAYLTPCSASLTQPPLDLSQIKSNHSSYSVKFAVRSGAPVSMPGLLKTRLNVKFSELEVAIKEVWDSWNSDHAKLYRAEKGIDDSLGTGVIIQQMIQARYSGVAFTDDPTNCSDVKEFNPVIEYVEGLGEQLVSGEVQPRTAGPGTLEFNYQRLKDMLQNIHKKHGPSDVEWCLTGSYWGEQTYYFVQMRPLKYVPAPPIQESPEDNGRVVLASGIPIGCPTQVTADLVEATVGFKVETTGHHVYVQQFRPDYYPMMMKAKGIICGEGGVTCHAAIIARELGKPAVSGVKRTALLNAFGKPVTLHGGTGRVYVPSEGENLVAEEIQVTKSKPKRPNFELTRGYVWNGNELLLRFYTAIEKHTAGEITDDRKLEVIQELADIMSTYMYVICVCEMRHISRQGISGGDNENKDRLEIIKQFRLRGVRLPSYGDFDSKNTTSPSSRDSFFDKGIPQPGSLHRAVEVMEWCVKGYNEVKWSSSFGGNKWGSIAQIVLSYLQGDTTPTLFLDSAFNLQHNGGSMFGKFTWMQADSSRLKQQLDAKLKSFAKLAAVTPYYTTDLNADLVIKYDVVLPEDEVCELLSEPALWVLAVIHKPEDDTGPDKCDNTDDNLDDCTCHQCNMSNGADCHCEDCVSTCDDTGKPKAYCMCHSCLDDRDYLEYCKCDVCSIAYCSDTGMVEDSCTCHGCLTIRGELTECLCGCQDKDKETETDGPQEAQKDEVEF